jgi:phosphate ABC transporter permease protein PstC/phosphate ABC transporter permease subunit PstA
LKNEDNTIKRVKKFNHDIVMKYLLMAVASATILIILFIIIFIFANSSGAIRDIGIIEFITGTVWKNSEGMYGAVPLIVGTLLVTFGAIMIALPLGLGTAVFISEVAPKRLRNILKPICEIFAGIPSVVYGFFGLVVLVPLLGTIFPDHLLSGTSWLAGSIILGIMALPTIISVSEDAMRAVPRSYREASMAMGATRWETTRRVVVPAAISGIAAATILGIGRAIGETIAVMMVTGNSPMIPEPLWNIFEMLRTITATLALEMPDAASGSTHYSALFLLALILMFIVLLINYVAKVVIKRARRKFGDTSGTSFTKKLPKLTYAVRIPKALWVIASVAITFTISAFLFNLLMAVVYSSFVFLISALLITVVFETAEKEKAKKEEKRPPRAKQHTILSKLMPNVMRSITLIAMFAFVWMMASLFFDRQTTGIIAFVSVIVMLASAPVGKKLGATIREKVAHGSLVLVMLIVVAILVVMLFDIVSKGLPALSLDFLLKYPEDRGMSGGIFPAIVGTIQLVVGTMMIAFPLGIISGIYLAEYSKNTRFTRIIREAIDLLNGTPSVVFGLFGMTALVIFLGVGIALIAGCITLAFMVLPVIIRTTEESILAVPKELREASLALGASKWETTIKVVIPAAFGGVITGLILSLGRAAGETAPIMFTAAAIYSSSISFSLLDPVMALPYHLYILATEVPGSTTMQYGTALVLLIMVLFMFGMASLARHRYSKNIKW